MNVTRNSPSPLAGEGRGEGVPQTSAVPANGLLKLLSCTTVITVIWLGVLPWIGRLPPVERHVQFLNDRNIDAGVMFYSELAPGVIPDQETVDEFLRSRTR